MAANKRLEGAERPCPSHAPLARTLSRRANGAADVPIRVLSGSAPANTQMEQTVGLPRRRADLPQLSRSPVLWKESALGKGVEWAAVARGRAKE